MSRNVSIETFRDISPYWLHQYLIPNVLSGFTQNNLTTKWTSAEYKFGSLEYCAFINEPEYLIWIKYVWQANSNANVKDVGSGKSDLVNNVNKPEADDWKVNYFHWFFYLELS